MLFVYSNRKTVNERTNGESALVRGFRLFVQFPILSALLLLSLHPFTSLGFPCVYNESGTGLLESKSRLPSVVALPLCVLKVQTINRERRPSHIPKNYVLTNSKDFADIIFCVGVNTYSVQFFNYSLRFRLQCSSPYPVQFEFKGLKPVDEISTYFYKSIKRNSSREITSYNVDIDFDNKSKMTGSYIISSMTNSSLETEFYFFMESRKEPFLLHYRNSEKAVINDDGSEALLPCRVCNWNMDILLYKVKADNNELINKSEYIRFDPKQGFLFNLTAEIPAEGQYLCVVDKGGGTPGDSLTVSMILPTRNQQSSLTNTIVDLQVLSSNRVLCTLNNITNEYRPTVLTNIEITNPTQAKLQQECVFQGEYCLNTDQRVGGYSSHCMCLEILQLAPQGIVMCATEGASIIQEYFTGLDGHLYCDSTLIPIPDGAVIRMTSLNATRDYGRANTWVYHAFKKYAFQCNISSYLLVKPIVWFRKLSNGSLIEESINYNRGFPNRDVWIDEIVLEVCPETVEVFCTASYWNSSKWVNDSNSLDVIVRRKPKINAKNPTILNFTTYQNATVSCEADGFPVPMLTWFRDRRQIRRSGQKHRKNLAIIFDRLTANDSGNYSCIAKNELGIDEVVFIFNVSGSATSDSSKSDLAYQIAIRVPLGILIFLGVVLAAYLIVRHRKRRGLTRKEIRDFERGTEIEMSELSHYVHENPGSLAYNKDFEIHESLNLDGCVILGSGAYGVVLKGKMRGQSVAIKTVKAGADKMYLMALLSELKIMIHIGKHPHVINLLGAKTSELHKGLVYIIVEYCPMGNLENVLRNQNRDLFIQHIHYNSEELLKMPDSYEVNSNHRNSTCEGFCLKDLILWSYQIATAMEYLTSKKVIHGDLAIRNVLLLNREIAKVTDFGLSRKLYDYITYVKKQQEPLPWRWLAIEALQSMSFSSKSDVWSFGVTLWEIFSLGDIPYPGLSWSVDFVDKLEQGLRLMNPKYSSNELYSLMQLCWANNPEDRPTFSELKKSFYLQLVRISGDKYVDLDIS